LLVRLVTRTSRYGESTGPALVSDQIRDARSRSERQRPGPPTAGGGVASAGHRWSRITADRAPRPEPGGERPPADRESRGPTPAPARTANARAWDPVPDPATVKLGSWLRLQARIAPVDRLLAREAAEEDDVEHLYEPNRPPGIRTPTSRSTSSRGRAGAHRGGRGAPAPARWPGQKRQCRTRAARGAGCQGAAGSHPWPRDVTPARRRMDLRRDLRRQRRTCRRVRDRRGRLGRDRRLERRS
jgi:hypothetical protein